MEKISAETINKVASIYDNTIDTLDDILVGQKNVKKVIASSILCDTRSKILLTGITGVGKTTLSNFFARNFDSLRISVTSDLLPTEIQEQLKAHQSIRLLQLEEFNRASGKVLATFNELFAEGQLTLDGLTSSFNDFYVFATQNNIDISGIFNVPFAVLDRFDVNVAYEDLSYEEKRQLLFGEELKTDRKLNEDDIRFTKSMVDSLVLKKKSEDLLLAMFNIIDSLSYDNKRIFAGSNIRAHKFAIRLAKFNALVDGRDYIKPRDLADFINCLYLHRINQSVIKMDDADAQQIFYDAQKRILKIR